MTSHDSRLVRLAGPELRVEQTLRPRSGGESCWESRLAQSRKESVKLRPSRINKA